MACILFWSSAVRVFDSQAYRKMDVTRERISRILELREMLEHCKKFRFQQIQELPLHSRTHSGYVISLCVNIESAVTQFIIIIIIIII